MKTSALLPLLPPFLPSLAAPEEVISEQMKLLLFNKSNFCGTLIGFC